MDRTHCFFNFFLIRHGFKVRADRKTNIFTYDDV